MGNTYREGMKQRELHRKGEIVVCVRAGQGIVAQSVVQLKQNGMREKNSPFQHFGILFFPPFSLLLRLLKRFGGLQQRRFA